MLLLVKSRSVSASLKRGTIAEIAGYDRTCVNVPNAAKMFRELLQRALCVELDIVSVLLLQFSTPFSKQQLPSALNEKEVLDQ